MIMNETVIDIKKLSQDEKAALAQRVYEKAYFYDGEYGSCPQAVLSAIQDELGDVISDDVIRSGHNLAGGGALLGGGTCGALVGGLMALSCKFGRPRKMFGKGAFMKSHEVGKTLTEFFLEKYGAVTCIGVQEKIFDRSYDLWDRKDYAAFDKAGAHTDKCPSVAGDTAKWAVELMME